MSDQFSVEPTNRDVHTVFGELIAEYERSLATGVDWNGDAYRKILGFIVDVARLGGVDTSMADVRAELAKRNAAAAIASHAGIAPDAPAVQGYPTADEIAAAIMRQSRETGQSPAEVVGAHTAAPAAWDKQEVAPDPAPATGTDAG